MNDQPEDATRIHEFGNLRIDALTLVSPPCLIFRFAGEMDLYSVGSAKEALTDWLALSAANGDRYLAFDLRAVDYIDSTGLGLLIYVAKIQQADPFKGLCVVTSRQETMRVFTITRLDAIFSIAETLEEAVAAAKPVSLLAH